MAVADSNDQNLVEERRNFSAVEMLWRRVFTMMSVSVLRLYRIFEVK